MSLSWHGVIPIKVCSFNFHVVITSFVCALINVRDKSDDDLLFPILVTGRKIYFNKPEVDSRDFEETQNVPMLAGII